MRTMYKKIGAQGYIYVIRTIYKKWELKVICVIRTIYKKINTQSYICNKSFIPENRYSRLYMY